MADSECILQTQKTGLAGTLDVRVEKGAELEKTARFLARAILREMTIEKGRTRNKCIGGGGKLG